MRTARLFHVLVVQGSLAFVGCDGDSGTEPPADTDNPSTSTPDPSSTSGSTPSTNSGSSSDPSGSTSEDGGPATTTTGQTTGNDADGEPPRECSDPPIADDPCGCPCCWAMTAEEGGECLNTDDVCCSGFSEACTPV